MIDRRDMVGRTTALLCVLLFAVLLASGAALADAMDPLVEVQLDVDGEAGQGYLLVTGTLPPEVSLPATLSLPVPDGAEVVWAGEITGGGPSEDIERRAIGVPGEGGTVLQMRLETTRTGQYDALFVPTTVDGDVRGTTLPWVQSSPASDLIVRVVFPLGAQDADTEPTPASGPVTNAAGKSLYVIPHIESPELGESYPVSATYVSGTLLGDTGGDGGTDLTLIVLGALIAVAAVVLYLVVRSQRSTQVVAGDEWVDDDEEAPAPVDE